MKKNGFTLIEIAISITLLSVVLLFVVNFLTFIRDDEGSISYETKLELTKNLVSKSINEDIKKNSGIKTLSCSEYSCLITLNNDEERSLSIDEEYSIIYNDLTNNKKIYSKAAPINYAKNNNERLAYHIKNNSNSTFFIITIEVSNNSDFNIDIISKK